MALPILLGLGIGVGAGLAKSTLVDRPREKKARKLAADTHRYSPWTRLTPGAIPAADPLGSALSFGLTGAQLGSSVGVAKINADMAKQYQGGHVYPVLNPMAGVNMTAPAQSLIPQAYAANAFDTNVSQLQTALNQTNAAGIMGGNSGYFTGYGPNNNRQVSSFWSDKPIYNTPYGYDADRPWNRSPYWD